MSFTRTVLPVTSVFHSSRPLMPSSAENSSALFKTVKAFGEEPTPWAVLMSFTCTVPLSVPSLFQSSRPVAPSSAEKYRALLKTVSPETREPAPEVGLMSFTRTVLPVTSVFHSSTPVPSSAEKYKALLNTVKPDGEESPVGLMSFTCTVPNAVPSLFHSSMPLVPSLAEKYKVSLNTVSPVGEEQGTWIPPMEHVPGAMSFTCTVLPVTSVFHSSRPLTSSAEKYNALPRTVNSRGEETAAVTRTVTVPSLFHSSGPVPLSAEKNQAPLKKTNSEGEVVPPAPGKEFPARRLMSFTKLVPFAVPSVFHSSMPLTPSLAARSMMLGALAPLAPPPHPASAKADASTRALVTLHSGPIKLSSRWIMVPTFHPRDRPRLSLRPRPSPSRDILLASGPIP